MIIVFAFLAIQTSKLRQAVIYLGVFTLISSFVYMLYAAPDVALAEAVIGCTLSTILYLVAIKRYRIITVYFLKTQEDEKKEPFINTKPVYLQEFEKFLIKHEYELQIIYSHSNREELMKERNFDYLILDADMPVCICLNESYRESLLEKYNKENIHKFDIQAYSEDKYDQG
jgi:uncharacterized MnhB-related membrane protein